MGKTVFESVDAFITRNVSSFRDRDYYREMEKEITKDVESLRERRTERARRRKLHFHRGYPLLLHRREYAYRARPRNCFSATIHAPRTNIHIENISDFPSVSILRQIFKNLYSVSFFLSSFSRGIFQFGYKLRARRNGKLWRSEKYFSTRKNSLLKLLISKRFVVDLVFFFFYFHGMESCSYNEIIEIGRNDKRIRSLCIEKD